MKIAAPFPLPGGPDNLYEYCVDHRFSPEVKRRSRLLTAIIPCLTGIGCLYQAVATARDRRAPPSRQAGGCRRLPAARADVGPRPPFGRPGIGSRRDVLRMGMDSTGNAKFSRVVSYDRAGLGWSGPDPAPKTAVLAARRLRSVLLHSRVPPPYVLVGHSMGGLFIRVFADLFPDEVAGMVLIDAVHPDQHMRSAARIPDGRLPDEDDRKAG